MNVDIVAFEIELREAIAAASAAFDIPSDLYRYFENVTLELAKERITASKLEAAERAATWAPPAPGWAVEHAIAAAKSFVQSLPEWALMPAHGGVS